MAFRFLKICCACFVVSLSGTITSIIFFRREVNTIKICTVDSVVNTGIRADCGHGTKIYHPDKPIRVTKPVCLQGTSISNCNMFNTSLLMGMIAVGVTLSFLLLLLIFYDALWWCCNYENSRPYPDVIQIRIVPVEQPPESPRRVQTFDIPLQEVCVSGSETIIIGTSNQQTVVVKNP